MTTAARPNTALVAARKGRRMSQDDLAVALRGAGCASATKRTVQRWEDGTTRTPTPSYASALQKVFRLPMASLGFEADLPVHDDGHGGHDVQPHSESAHGLPRSQGRPTPGSFTGIWLSHYQYYSSGREKTLSTGHYVVVTQHDSKLTVRSLPGSAPSTMSMDLTIDGNAADGTWVEDTDPAGYYRGARYHGAIQLLAEPTGTRLKGKWVGFGKNFEINSGPWELVFMDPSLAKSTVDEYNHPPDFDAIRRMED